MVNTNSEIIFCVKAYTKEMLGYAIAKLNNKEVAEDLVQDTFLSAYQSYRKYKGNSNIKTWLFSILKHKIADHYRLKFSQKTESIENILEKFFDENERWRPEHRPVSWGDEKELLDDPEFAKALKHCFDRLPVNWSSAVQLRYLEEHNTETICSELEISKTNFWQIIHRAKLQLRNCLEVKWFK